MEAYSLQSNTKPQNIYESPYGPLSVPTNSSVSQFLTKYNPDDVPGSKILLSDFHDSASNLTYSSLRSRAAQCSTGLINVLNLKEGDVVCIWGLNSVNWVLLAHSVMWAGGIFAGINAVSTKYELVHYVEIAQPKVIAVDVGMLGRLDEALIMMKSSARPKVMLIEDENTLTSKNHLLFPRDIEGFSTAQALPFDLSYRDNRNIPAAMCFSSGTSGKPKGVLLSHHNLIGYCLTARTTSPLITNCHQTEVFFPPFPHIYGIAIAVMGPAFTGQHVVAMKKFDFLPYLKKSVEVRSTVARLVPATAIQLIKDPAVQSLDLTSINTIFCAGASLQDEVAEALARKLEGVCVLNGYGMSEGTIASIRETWCTIKPGSVGKPQAGVQIRIVNDDYSDVEPGQSGECLVKGPTIFMGYINNDAATKEAFRDGWLCTGDVIRAEEDGFLWLMGRKKELIKFKGNQVPPAELEAVLLSHPMVNDAGVCGMWDHRLETEVPVGYVNFTENVETVKREEMLTEIKTFVQERVSPHKKLRGGLFYLDVLPKGPTGKLLRKELPAMKRENKLAKL